MSAHDIFRPPDDETIPIWRYIDLAKYVSLLDSRALHFARTDRLGDPFEGSVPEPNFALRGTVIDAQQRSMAAAGLNLSRAQVEGILNQAREAGLAGVMVNCWHMNQHESAAMWRLYVESGQGVAIRSSYARLRRALPEIYDDFGILIGVVRYIDYSTETIPEGDNLLWPFIHKRMSYAHERELRAALIHRSPAPEVLAVPANLEELIERVYVAPQLPNWFTDVVQVITKRFGFEFEVLQSGLDAKPLF